MKKTIHWVILLFILMAMARPGQAQTTVAVAADSVAESRIVAAIGADICRQLAAENRKRPLQTLSQDDTRQLFIQLMLTSLAGNPELMKKIAAHPEEAHASGEAIGRKVGLWLFRECAVSRPMIMRLGTQELNKSQKANTSAEEALLTPMAAQMCLDMEPYVAKQAKKPLTQEQNQALFQSVLTPYMLNHMEEMRAVYGDDIFEDKARMQALGMQLALKIGDKCPAVMALLVDSNRLGR